MQLDEAQLRYIKEYGSVTMSAVALIISLTTLYINNRNIDDVSVIFGPGIGTVALIGGEYRVAPKHTLTFINSGTNHVAIQKATLLFEQTDKETFRKCEFNKDSLTMIELNLEPFIIKPFEIAVKPTEFKLTDMTGEPIRKGDGWKLTTAGTMSFPTKQDTPHRLLTCGLFALTTPDNYVVDAIAPIKYEQFENNDRSIFRVVGPKPITLLRKSVIADTILGALIGGLLTFIGSRIWAYFKRRREPQQNLITGS